MAIDTTFFEDFNSQAKRAVEQTKEQVVGAVDNYFNSLQRTISSYPTGGSELGEKIKDYAEKNIAATHEFLLNVSRAKDFQEIFRIQNEFMQAQMIAFGQQTKNFGESYTKASKSAVNTPYKTSRSGVEGS